ncbi:tRNA N6-adenosine threonylcarbamoyltransferase, mitochondrial [Oligella sp. MSHR50489EDL]|uniref:tRNA (adenosine(37)-N6)-threonylcarbamoyltransferase complex dimerization subunit type 1 TsaB n=1 Tax=Oligella sp. MSHR50489EDL TaxID=3139409 RepID=UPI003D81BACF
MKKYLLAIESAASESSVAILEVDSLLDDKGVTTYEAGREWVAFNRSGSLDHAEQLLPLVDSLLAEAAITRNELMAVAFSQGPGAFTGLRIACGLAQGIALGLDLPVIPIDSLRAGAQLALDYLLEIKQLNGISEDLAERKKRASVDYVVTLLDARMSEAYMAIYQLKPIAAADSDTDKGLFDLKVVQKPCLISINDVLLWLDRQRIYDDRRLFFCGNALQVYAKELAASFEQKSFDFTVVPDQVTEWAGAAVIARLAFRKWRAGETIEAHLAAPIYLRDKVAFTEQERAAGLIGNPSAAMPQATQPVSAGRLLEADTRLAFQIAHEQYQLRPMLEEDIAGALLIEQTVQDYPWTRGNFKDSLRSGYPAWVIEHEINDATGEARDEDKRIVGFAIQMLAPDVAHVLLIAVEPSLQGEGLGTLLLKVLEKNALAHGLDKQILEVRDSNDQAQRFYLRHRYAVIGKRKGYYREVSGASEDAIVLEKQLSSDDAAFEFKPHTEESSEAEE